MEKSKADGNFDGIFTAESPDDAFAYCAVLDRHAPIKVIQNRKDYVPYLSPHVKEMMAARDTLKETAAHSGRLDDYNDYKQKRNEVSTLLKGCEGDHFSI